MRTAPLDYLCDPPILMYRSSLVEADLRLKACSKEPETVAWLERLPVPSVVWDIGANVGPYSLLAVRLGHQVVSFEPVPVNYARLVDNMLLNGFDGPRAMMPDWARMMPLPFAVGSRRRPTVTSLPVRDGAVGATAGAGYTDADLHVPAVEVSPGWLVEEFRLPAPDAVKVDVDGGELEVLAGLEGIVGSVRSLLVEVTPDSESPVRDWMDRWGFGQVTAHLHKSGVSNLIATR